MTTVEAPVVNTAPALPQGLEEIIHASVEKALATLLANRRSQWRGRHCKTDFHHREQSDEEGHMKFDGPWNHHGMKRGPHGMKHGHPGKKHGHHGMEDHHGMKHGHPGKKHGHHGMEDHPGMKHGPPGMKHGHHGMDQGQHDMKHGHPGMRHGHHGMRHGHHGMRHGHHGMKHGQHGMRRGHPGMRCGQRFSFLACGARLAEQQRDGEDKPVEVVDLVGQEESSSAEGELQKGIENMNVGDNAPAAGSDE